LQNHRTRLHQIYPLKQLQQHWLRDKSSNWQHPPHTSTHKRAHRSLIACLRDTKHRKITQKNINIHTKTRETFIMYHYDISTKLTSIYSFVIQLLFPLFPHTDTCQIQLTRKGKVGQRATSNEGQTLVSSTRVWRTEQRIKTTFCIIYDNIYCRHCASRREFEFELKRGMVSYPCYCYNSQHRRNNLIKKNKKQTSSFLHVYTTESRCNAGHFTENYRLARKKFSQLQTVSTILPFLQNSLSPKISFGTVELNWIELRIHEHLVMIVCGLLWPSLARA